MEEAKNAVVAEFKEKIRSGKLALESHNDSDLDDNHDNLIASEDLE